MCEFDLSYTDNSEEWFLGLGNSTGSKICDLYEAHQEDPSSSSTTGLVSIISPQLLLEPLAQLAKNHPE